MARIWTSDLHFGHANIIRYCHRPFADVEAMNAGLVERWNEKVAPTDEVWVLGDFALGTITDTLPLAHRLHGTKVLVAGNHDRCWAGWGERARPWVETYLEAGFDEVLQGSVPVTVGPYVALACHLPYEGDSHDDDRFVSQRPTDDGTMLLHGHVHDRWRVNGHQVNVGVDAWDYRPVSDDQVIEEYVRAQP
ncbi:MAG: metallophosphoesterase [Ilumatobacteraceae bacterium]|nr:metallophosphoesterase [Ilumatobacteraceae bacterium]